MLNILDAIIILTLLGFAVVGFKRGVIQSAVMFFGTIVFILLAYYLKNPLSVFMYSKLPFINFSGIAVINILIYEAIAFLIVFSVLMILFRIILKVSGLIETFLKMTIILSIPSKILGLLFGFAEGFLLTFIGLFVINNFCGNRDFVTESRYADKILQNTPIISKYVDSSVNSIKEIYSLKDKYESKTNNDAYNYEALGILLKYKVIKTDSVKELVSKGKLKINNIDKLYEKYQEDNND